MNRKVMTTVRLSRSLEQELLRRVVEDGYNFRSKSRWIEEAVVEFFSLPDFGELVNIAGDMDKLEKTVSVRFSEALAEKIELTVVEVRQSYPALEGVKSNIIRAGIMQRLIRT